MKYVIYHLLLFLFPFSAQSQSTQLNQELDTYIDQVITEYGVPGIALAVIKDGAIVHKQNYGFANIEHQAPVKDHSIFRLYSLTKPIIAVGMFSLVEQGKLSLEDPISTYVAGLPNTWHKVQIKHLLTHSSGLPSMSGNTPYEVQDLTEEQAKERVFAMDIISQPGQQYDYDRTNFWLLKEIIEKVTSMPMQEFILNHQFPSSTNDSIFFSSDSREIFKHRATPYFPFLKGHMTIDLPYVAGDYSDASNGLNSTIDQLIQWDDAMRKNELISEATKLDMWKPFAYTQSDQISAYGWGIYEMNGKTAYGFSGSLSTMYVTIPEADLSIIYLSNGFANWYRLNSVINDIVTISMNN